MNKAPKIIKLPPTTDIGKLKYPFSLKSAIVKNPKYKPKIKQIAPGKAK